MKKITCGILCALIAFAMIFALAACGGTDDTEKFVGIWKSEQQLSNYMDLLGEMDVDDPEILDYLKLDGISITIMLTFNKDGTFISMINKESYETAMKKIFENTIIATIEDTIATMGLDMSVDEYLAELETTIDELYAQSIDEEVLSEGLAQSSRMGNWKVENGKLYTTNELSADFDMSAYETYTISGTTLTLTGIVGSGADDAAIGAVYPMTFTKQ